MEIRIGNGLKYKSVRSSGVSDYDAEFIKHIDFANEGDDKKAKNYNLTHIDRMMEYGYVYANDDPSDLVFMVGIEDFGEGCARCECRLFIHPNYRTYLWSPPRGYYDLIMYQVDKHDEDIDFLFKSREAANSATLDVTRTLNPFFEDWVTHPEKLELKYKNNFQWVMYRDNYGLAKEKIEYLRYKE